MARILQNYAPMEIEQTYFDVMDIYRMVESVQTNGSIKMVRQVIYEGIPCAYSVGTRPNLNSVMENSYYNNESGSANRVRTQPRVFCSPAIFLKQGDEFIITTNYRYVTVTAGEPVVYPCHQVMHVQEVRYA